MSDTLALERELAEELLAEVQSFWRPLPDKPEETPDSVLRALWLTACGEPMSVGRAAIAELPVLDTPAEQRLRALIDRKRAGVPLAHLTGRQEFLGLELLAGPDALIPRRETEILGRAALAKIRAMACERGRIRVIDVCTGAGNLALAYAYHEPMADVFGSDLSVQALSLARRNAVHCGLDERIELRAGDLLAPFETSDFLGRCDFLSCNPPYIPAARVPEMPAEISRYEPQLAFNGGVYGISILTKLLRDAPRFLGRASWLGFEVGAGQGPAMMKRLEKIPAFVEIESYNDAAGEIRAILARTP
jgi:release factor glutamine methyltransferase